MAPLRKTRKGRGRMRKTQRGRGRLVLKDKTTIFRPPLKCKDGSNAPYQSNDYIGKVSNHDTTARTTWIMQALKAIDPAGEYTIPPLVYCELAPEQDNANAKNNIFKKGDYKFLEIQKYGGISLGRRFRGKKPLKTILLPLEAFFSKLEVFNKHFIHSDLHPNNLVWDGSVYKMIDFDYMDTKNSIKDNIKNELELLHKNNNARSNENVQKELDTHIEMYMKIYDINSLTSDILWNIEKYYDDELSAEILERFHAEPLSPDFLIEMYELKDYRSAWAWLFSKLKEA
jgi:hypothetical protein